MAKARVLIVDDSAVIRRLLADQISTDAELEVVGHASNGRIALQRVEQLSPDAVVLDVEMPELGGLATLAQLRRTRPKLPVIMFSALTEPAAAATVDALLLGANDYVTKPTASEGIHRIREELIPKIKAACGRGGAALLATPSPGPGTALRKAGLREGPAALPAGDDGPAPRPDILLVGASTGGPNALTTFFLRLPAEFPVPIALVQHMPPMFTGILAERLTQASKIRVCEAVDGMALEAGRAYVAPGDFHKRLRRAGMRVCARLDREPLENACRPAVDALFRSAAEVYGRHILAVVMTGMGQDGLRGSRAVREAGGRILAQDEATSVVWGMPGAVAREGLADRVLPLDILGLEVMHRVREHPDPAGARSRARSTG